MKTSECHKGELLYKAEVGDYRKFVRELLDPKEVQYKQTRHGFTKAVKKSIPVSRPTLGKVGGTLTTL